MININNKQPNIQRRLITGLLVILFAISFLYAVINNNLNKINKINRDIIEHPFTVSNAIKDIDLKINDIIWEMRDIINSQDIVQLIEAINHVNENDKYIIDNFQIVKERFLGDKTDLDETYRAFNDWRPIRNEVISLIQQGNREEAYNLMVGKGFQHVKQIQSKISVLINSTLNKVNEFNRDSENISRKTVNQSIILLTIISLLLIIVLIWIFISINNPLVKISKRIQKLYKNKPGNLTIPKTKNILDILETSIENMEKLFSGLEELVKTRTQELQDEKEKTELALNNQSDTFLVIDPDLNQAIIWNKALSEVSGYSDKEIKTIKAPYSFHKKEDLKLLLKKINHSENEKIELRMNLVTKNKKEIPYEYHISSYKDKKTSKSYVVSVGHDLTNRIKYETELEHHRNHLQELIEEKTKELQAANEELITTNEELAVVNEELTASNEELVTANEELEKTTNKLTKSYEELSEANNDLERFNQLFINREFRIKELKEKVKDLQNELNNKLN